MTNRILLIGLRPGVVDYSQLPGMTAEKLAAGLEEQEAALNRLGFAASWCLVDAGETAEAVALEALQARRYDVVLIGAGVRTLPKHFRLFERLVNLVHEHAPGSRICFNTNPSDTTEAVLRWAKPPSSAT